MSIDYRYSTVSVELDPEQSDPLSDGGRLQDVSLILTDRHREAPSVGIALLACQARELAFELLQAAEQAGRIRRLP